MSRCYISGSLKYISQEMYTLTCGISRWIISMYIVGGVKCSVDVRFCGKKKKMSGIVFYLFFPFVIIIFSCYYSRVYRVTDDWSQRR